MIDFDFYCHCLNAISPFFLTPGVAGEVDSRTIEVLASWMLEHPLTEELQMESQPAGASTTETPSPDGPETVQCPEAPTSEPNERSDTETIFLHFFNPLS